MVSNTIQYHYLRGTKIQIRGIFFLPLSSNKCFSRKVVLSSITSTIQVGTLNEIMQIDSLRRLRLHDSGPITPKFDFSQAKNLEHLEIIEANNTPNLKKSTLPTGKRFRLDQLRSLKIVNVKFDPRQGSRLFYDFPVIESVKIIGTNTENYVNSVLGFLRQSCSNATEFSVTSDELISDKDPSHQFLDDHFVDWYC